MKVFTPLWAPGCFTRLYKILWVVSLGWKTLPFEYCVTVSQTESSSIRSHGVFTTNLGSRYWYCCYFTDEETKAQGSQEVGPGSHISEASGQSLEFRVCDVYVRTFDFNNVWNLASLPQGLISASRVSLGVVMNLKSKHAYISTLDRNLAFPCLLVDFIPGRGHFPILGVLRPDSLGRLRYHSRNNFQMSLVNVSHSPDTWRSENHSRGRKIPSESCCQAHATLVWIIFLEGEHFSIVQSRSLSLARALDVLLF